MTPSSLAKAPHLTYGSRDEGTIPRRPSGHEPFSLGGIMRVAIYYTPRADHPLTRAAALWLGRDAFTGQPLPTPPADAIDVSSVTAEPRRYGFHATMKAPFRLPRDRTLAELDRVLAAFCARIVPIKAMQLKIERLGSFFALTPASNDGAVVA